MPIRESARLLLIRLEANVFRENRQAASLDDPRPLDATDTADLVSPE